MRTTNLFAISLAVVVGSSSIGCSGGDGEELGQTDDELTTVGDETS